MHLSHYLQIESSTNVVQHANTTRSAIENSKHLLVYVAAARDRLQCNTNEESRYAANVMRRLFREKN